MQRTRAPPAAAPAARAPPAAAAAAAAAAALLLVALATLPLAAGDDDILYNITEEQYYEMPQLFELDEYEGCLAARGLYCMATFELAPAADAAPSALFTRMQRYSANWVDNFNHTRLHRAWCVSRRCPAPAALPAAAAATAALPASQRDQLWFQSCVNESTMGEYNLSARLLRLQYCERGPRAPPPPLAAAELALAALLALLLALAALGTVLDSALPDHAKKKASWALSWSVGARWRELAAPARGGPLAVLDGLRALCVLCVLIEHVCWLATQAYLADTRNYEQMRRTTEGMLMVNSTLVVQIFFLMSSFLLAHKLLAERERGECAPPLATFASTMLHRLIRVSPSYWVVVWWAAAGWARAGAGPQWAPAVGAESAVCRAKWWAHLLYLNNVVRPDDKCLIQTWYLAADMQLYAAALGLALALRGLRRGAVPLLAALLAAAVAAPFAMAYHWNLMPTYVTHRPELVRQAYAGEASFNVLYQSPLSNAPGALGGLLLAFVHHQRYSFTHHKAFRVASVCGPYAAALWAALSPRLLGPGPPRALPAAALAALERPVFAFFVALGLLGALNGVRSPLRWALAWRGWALPARLSFGVLLLHLPLHKTLVAARPALSRLDRHVAFVETFGLAGASALAALPLALLVELPAQRLLRPRPRPPAPAPLPADCKPPPAPLPPADTTIATVKTDL